jgi:hypothetical protein
MKVCLASHINKRVICGLLLVSTSFASLASDSTFLHQSEQALASLEKNAEIACQADWNAIYSDTRKAACNKERMQQSDDAAIQLCLKNYKPAPLSQGCELAIANLLRQVAPK